MKILVLEGPNWNLLGIGSAKDGSRLTLSKIDTMLRKKARAAGVELKIFQTHDEGKANSILHRNRNKVAGLIFAPGPWQMQSHVLKETLALLPLPFVTLSLESGSFLFEAHHCQDANAVIAFEAAFEKIFQICKETS